MALPDPDTLKTKIILLFMEKPLLQAQAIHQKLPAYTLQAVYKELRGLCEQGIVQKVRKDYSINSVWVLQLQALATKMARTCFGASSAVPLLAEQESASWKFSNLLDMNDFWGHMVLHLMRTSGERVVYAWNPHLWFYLFQEEKEDRFAKTIHLMGGKFCILAGGSSFLNLWARKFMARGEGIQSSFARSPLKDKMNTYYNIIGPYVITAKLAPSTFRALDKIYGTTTSFEKLDIQGLLHLFTKNGHATLTLEHDPGKAKRLRQMLEPFFNVS